MDLDEYQDLTEETAVYPDELPNFVSVELLYVMLGMAGEAGENLEKLKKAIREDDPSYIEDLKKEQGDVLWYWSRVNKELDLTNSEVAEANLDKLFDRRERGVLTGEGDNR